MPSRRRSLSTLLLVAVAVAAAAAAGPAGEPRDIPVIAYRLSVPEPAHRELQVQLVVTDLHGPLDLRMSRTSPGRYALHEFAKNVFDVQATDGAGRSLDVQHVEASRWLVPGHDGTVTVRYRVFGDRVDGTYLAIGPAHAHINPPAALAWPAGLDRPITIAIDVPAQSGWTVATQLLPGSAPNTWEAPTFQYLMDSPIEMSRFVMRTFEADLPEGTPGPRPTIAVVLHHLGGDEEIAPIVEGLRRVVRSAASVFGEYPPFEGGRYTFLLDYLPWATGDGMEHRNSTVITGSAEGATIARQALETAAHEFFHAWNVERIRPRALEPFDFERPAASGELWLAEGVTQLLPGRDAGARRAWRASTRRSAASGRSIEAVAKTPALAFRSAAEMSRMASLVDGANPRRSHQLAEHATSRTTRTAHALGARPRPRDPRADRQRALARRLHAGDVARARPARWCAAGLGRRAVHARRRPGPARRGHRRSAFGDALVTRYVEGRERMDYAHLLLAAGLILRQRHPGRPSFGQTTLQPTGDGLRLASQPPLGSPLYLAGLGEGDEITAVNGRSVTGFDTLERAIARLGPGATVSLRFARRGEREERSATAGLVEDASLELVAVEKTGGTLSDAQRVFRDRWIGAR